MGHWIGRKKDNMPFKSDFRENLYILYKVCIINKAKVAPILINTFHWKQFFKYL